MIGAIIAFLVMLNPFALFLYLVPVMDELANDKFRKLMFKATLTSFGIFILFLFIGDILISTVFQINFESFRIFGGIVIFSFSYFFIVKGQRGMIQIKENLDDLASEIALPFMVGAGTISLTILMSYQFSFFYGVIGLVVIMLLDYLLIMLLKLIKDRIAKDKFKIAFDKNMEILLRLNGFFMGAIGVNMVLTGIKNIFF